MSRIGWTAATAACLTACAALWLPGVAGDAAAGTAPPASFTDPSGDVTGAPDISSITVGDDATSGVITVTATVTGIAPTSDFTIYLDTDRNPGTGSPSGSEYLLNTSWDADGRYWDVGRWANGKWQSAPDSTTVSFSRSGDVYTWLLARSDLGNPTGFNFWGAAVSYDESGNVTAHDAAPDDGTWLYVLSAAPKPKPAADSAPRLGTTTTTPPKAVAGKRFLVALPVTRSDTGDALLSGSVQWNVTVAGKPVAHTGRFVHGVASVTLLVPPSARGKVLRVQVTVHAGGKASSRAVSFHVA